MTRFHFALSKTCVIAFGLVTFISAIDAIAQQDDGGPSRTDFALPIKYNPSTGYTTALATLPKGTICLGTEPGPKSANQGLAGAPSTRLYVFMAEQGTSKIQFASFQQWADGADSAKRETISVPSPDAGHSAMPKIKVVNSTTKFVKIEPGRAFEISVPDNPSTGYEQAVTHMSKGIYLIDALYKAPEQQRIGGGGARVFRFYASPSTSAGKIGFIAIPPEGPNAGVKAVEYQVSATAQTPMVGEQSGPYFEIPLTPNASTGMTWSLCTLPKGTALIGTRYEKFERADEPGLVGAPGGKRIYNFISEKAAGKIEFAVFRQYGDQADKAKRDTHKFNLSRATAIPTPQQTVKTMTVEGGRSFEIKVPENPSTGYQNAMTHMSKGLYLIDAPFKGPEQPIPGAGGIRTYRFFVSSKASKATVRFVSIPPGSPDGAIGVEYQIAVTGGNQIQLQEKTPELIPR